LTELSSQAAHEFLLAAQADPTSCKLDSPVLTIDLSDGSVYTVDWSGTRPAGAAKSVYEGGKVKFGKATGPGVVPAILIRILISLSAGVM
jgi:hypothetical protein